MYFISNVRCQNTFVYQPKLDTLELKKDKGKDYVLSKKKVYHYKLKPLYSALLHLINLPEYRIGIKFKECSLVVEKNNDLTKIVGVCIVYDLVAWSRNPSKNFKCKNCLIGAISVVKNSNKENYVYNGYGITFENGALWSFDQETSRSVLILGVDNSSLSHPDNQKKN